MKKISFNSFKKKYLNRLPYIRDLVKEIEIYKYHVGPGHFYSPVVSVDDIKNRIDNIFSKEKELLGIELNKIKQYELLQNLKKYYNALPFTDEKSEKLRYFYKNDSYSYSDAIFLYSIIRYFKPNRIIEVGSGYSSGAMLDTDELFMNKSIKFTFIDPRPGRLLSCLEKDDFKRINIIKKQVQDVDYKYFEGLLENDILFIDSTHVSKTGSDVNYLLFEVLPRLKEGVLIHFHDIFYPFEYTKEHVINLKGFGWNEDYILRAFLTSNFSYKIILFNTYLEYLYKEWFEKEMPLCLVNPGGSIWIKKI